MANTYTLISSTIFTGSTSSVTLSSIPSTYTDLVLRMSLRSSGNAFNTEIIFNGDQSSIYSQTLFFGNGSAISNARYTDTTQLDGVYAGMEPSAGTANTFNNVEIYIPNYRSTTSKPMSSIMVTESNVASDTATRIVPFAQLYRNTSAITSITLQNGFSFNFVSGSSIYLYGIKNS
jgi:hypothetical protein